MTTMYAIKISIDMDTHAKRAPWSLFQICQDGVVMGYSNTQRVAELFAEALLHELVQLELSKTEEAKKKSTEPEGTASGGARVSESTSRVDMGKPTDVVYGGSRPVKSPDRTSTGKYSKPKFTERAE